MKPEQYEKISLFDVHPGEYALTGYWDECSKNPHVKYTFATPSKPMYLAGIYHKEDGNFHLVILAEKAGYPQSDIHSRQSVIFTYEDAKKRGACKHPTSLLQNSIPERSILSE